MQTPDQLNERAADLYWLAFLLTGDRTPSVDATLEVLDLESGSHRFFSTWMLAWSRKVVISKALAAIRNELAASARRTESQRVERAALAPRNWRLDPETTKVHLERAILAIDAFPRCALVLTIFENLSLEDVEVLLDRDRDFVRKAQMIGLQKLTRNLARMQTGTSGATDSVVLRNRLQHA